jgi:predicted Ser/Thr protein kinase
MRVYSFLLEVVIPAEGFRVSQVLPQLDPSYPIRRQKEKDDDDDELDDDSEDEHKDEDDDGDWDGGQPHGEQHQPRDDSSAGAPPPPTTGPSHPSLGGVVGNLDLLGSVKQSRILTEGRNGPIFLQSREPTFSTVHKPFPADKQLQEEALNEYEIYGKVAGLGIAPDVWAASQETGLVLTFEGMSLIDLEPQSLNVDSIVGQARHLLIQLHRLGLLHCDARLENLVLNPQGRLFLIDFGFTRQTNSFFEQFEELMKLGPPKRLAPLIRSDWLALFEPDRDPANLEFNDLLIIEFN